MKTYKMSIYNIYEWNEEVVAIYNTYSGGVVP